MSGLTMTLPLDILCTNVLGGFLMGLLQGAVERSGESFTVRYSPLGTGFLSGFATFSTFSLNAFNLYHTDDLMLAGLNTLLDTVICICAMWAGYRIAFPRATVA